MWRSPYASVTVYVIKLNDEYGGVKIKIGISSRGKDLDAEVDQRFGRCQYLLIIDSDTKHIESIDNQGAMASGGAGIQTAQTLARKGVDVVITGNVGPNAFQTLSAANIKIFTGATGTVSDALDKFEKGELHQANNPNVGSHFGMRP